MRPTISIFDASESTMHAIASRTLCDLNAGRWTLTGVSTASPHDGNVAGRRGIVGLGAIPVAAQHFDWIQPGDRSLWLASSICDQRTLESIEQACLKRSAVWELGNPIASCPGRALILAQLNSGKLGEPGVVRVHRWCRTTSSSPTPAINRLVEYEILGQELDCIQRCFKSAPVAVYASWQIEQRGLVVHLRYAEGCSALLDFQFDAHCDYSSFSLIGSLGSATIDDHPNTQLTASDGLIRAHRSDDVVDSQAHMVIDFLHRHFGSEPEVMKCEGFASWRATLKILTSVETSLDRGDVVSID